MILSGFSLINIVFKPVAIGEDGKPIGNKEIFTEFIKSFVKRYDFYIRRDGEKYLREILKEDI